MSAQEQLRDGMVAAQKLPCLFCGSSRVKLGGIWQLDPKTALLTGAAPGKLRHFIYSLCLKCARKPNLAKRVEDKVLRVCAVPERN